MKADMGGGASVIGAISAIAKRNLKINVIAVVVARKLNIRSCL